MASQASSPTRRERGFTLIETLIVVVIILIMAAMAFPNIGQYLRNYRIRGAAQLVAGELQRARGKAVMTNTNAGVSFFVVDADSYRIVNEDLPAGEELDALRDLPVGVRFVVATASSSGPSVRFNRLGGFCNPAGGGTCNAAFDPPCTSEEESTRCTVDKGLNYFAPDPAVAGGLVVTLLETTTTLQRTVRLAPGGRVLPQP